MRLRCPVDLGTKHVVACARTMCKQYFPESKRVVQLDNGRSVMFYPPCFVRRREGSKWNGLCGSRIGSSMSKSYFSTEMRLRDAGWVSSPQKTGRILGTRVRTPNLQDFSPCSCYKFLLRVPRDAGFTFKPGFHMSGKSQKIGNFTFCRPFQILPICRIFARGLSQIFEKRYVHL